MAKQCEVLVDMRRHVFLAVFSLGLSSFEVGWESLQIRLYLSSRQVSAPCRTGLESGPKGNQGPNEGLSVCKLPQIRSI